MMVLLTNATLRENFATRMLEWEPNNKNVSAKILKIIPTWLNIYRLLGDYRVNMHFTLFLL